jgi:hypothetical protein
MQVLDHGKNARIDRILKTFLGFLDVSHMCVCVVVPYSWTAGHFDPSAQYCTENWSPGATFIGMLTWTLKPSGVVTSTRVPGVALGSDTSGHQCLRSGTA